MKFLASRYLVAAGKLIVCCLPKFLIPAIEEQSETSLTASREGSRRYLEDTWKIPKKYLEVVFSAASFCEDRNRVFT